MMKMTLAGALVASVLLMLPMAANADSGDGRADTVKPRTDRNHGAAHDGHGGSNTAPSSLSTAWSALIEVRTAISNDIESGALGEIHAKAEPLASLVDALLDHSSMLDAAKRTRVVGASNQVKRVADSLHEAADGDDIERTRKELTRLDSLLKLIRAQYPPGALDAGNHRMEGHEGHSAAHAPDHGAHAHLKRPTGVVDEAPQADLRIEAFDPFRFQPRRIEVQAGVPTRIELANVGSADHSLVVRTPNGRDDWVHLHVLPGTSEAAVYRLDEPGTYSVICTIPGHQEGGMIGELVVVARRGSSAQLNR